MRVGWLIINALAALFCLVVSSPGRDAHWILASLAIGILAAVSSRRWQFRVQFADGIALVALAAAAFSARNELADRLWFQLPYIAAAAGLTLWRSAGWSARAARLGAFLAVSSPAFTELHVSRAPGALVLLALALLPERGAAGQSGNGWGRAAAPGLVLAGAFLLWSGMSSVQSVYPNASFEQWGVLLQGAVVAGLAMSLDRRSSVNMRNVFLILAVSCAAAGLIGPVIRVVHLGWLEAIRFRSFVFGRHPTYATFHVVVAMPLLAAGLFAGPVRRRLAHGAGLAVCLVYLPLSYERSSWLAVLLCAAGAAALTVRAAGRRGVVTALLAIAAAAGVGWLAAPTLPHIMKDRLASIARFEDSPRLTAWRAMADIARERPWFGPGLASKRYVFPQAAAVHQPYQHVTRQFLIEAHSVYIEFASAIGFPGALLWLAFLTIAAATKIHRRDAVSAGLLLATLAVIIDGFFHYRLFALDLANVSWLALAFTLRDEERDRIRLLERPGARRAGAAAAAAVLLFGALPGLADAAVIRGRRWAMAGDNVRAGQWFSVAAVIEPLNAHHIYYLGQAALARGAGDEALALLNRTVQLNPSFAFYRRELAAAALRANDPHLAASELQQAIRLEPFETEGSAAFLLGRLLWRTGQHSNARAYLALALNLNPTLAGDPFWTAVDDGQLRDELLRESVDECTTLYSDPTRQAEAFLRLHRLAHAWSAAGQPARGATALEWVLTESPASRQTRIELTQLYLDMDQVNSAREVMAGALALEPLYPAYMNAMARVLVRTGDVEGAIAMFEQALRHWTSISLDNYVAHLYLERLYAATGQQELADIEARKLRFIRSKLPEQQRDFEIHTGGDVDELRELEHELRRQTAAAGRQET